MTVVSAAFAPEAANHSRLYAARAIEFRKELAKPWMKTRMFFPEPTMS
jgi:hypothetical protein